MVKLDRNKLKKMIQLEIKALMDEDALFMQRNVPGDYEGDVANFRRMQLMTPQDDYQSPDEYDYDYDEDDYDSSLPVNRGMMINSPNRQIKMRLDEGDCPCDTGCSSCQTSKNPYEQEREQDFGHSTNYGIDRAMQSLTSLGGDVHVDFDHDDHSHSSYMARPQLYKIAKYATELLNMIDENEELQDWQESKIAQISQMIGSVYHSLDYDEEYDDHDDLDVHNLIGMIRTGNI